MLLADGFMSTHWHNIVRTEVPDELTASYRYAIDRQRISAVDVGDRFGGGRIASGHVTKKDDHRGHPFFI